MLIAWPPTVMVPPSSLIVKDWPLVPNGTVSGAAEIVKARAMPASRFEMQTILRASVVQ
jgi:hypothetical protein